MVSNVAMLILHGQLMLMDKMGGGFLTLNQLRFSVDFSIRLVFCMEILLRHAYCISYCCPFYVGGIKTRELLS